MKGDTQAALNLHAAADHSPRVSLGSEGVRATTGVITAVPSLWGLLDALFKSLLRSSPFCAGGVLSFRQHFWFAFVSWVLWSLHGDCDTEMYTAPPSFQRKSHLSGNPLELRSFLHKTFVMPLGGCLLRLTRTPLAGFSVALFA